MKKTNKIISMILVFILLTIVMCGCNKTDTPDTSTEETREKVKLLVAGSAPSGNSYVAGAALSEFMRTQPSAADLSISPQTTGGFLENIRLVETGDCDLGFTGSSNIIQAFNSLGDFSQENHYENIRVLFPTFTAALQFSTYKDDLQTLADMERLRINLSPPGSAGATMGELVLATSGISVKKEFQGWSEGIRLMQDDLIDIFAECAPLPSTGTMEAAAVSGKSLRFIEFGDELLSKILEENPEYIPLTIKANLYKEGVPSKDIESFGYIAYLIANKDVSEWAVYEVMKGIMSEKGQEHMINSLQVMKIGFEMTPGFEDMEKIGIKLHPGAVKYWEEQGIKVPDSLKD